MLILNLSSFYRRFCVSNYLSIWLSVVRLSDYFETLLFLYSRNQHFSRFLIGPPSHNFCYEIKSVRLFFKIQFICSGNFVIRYANIVIFFWQILYILHLSKSCFSFKTHNRLRSIFSYKPNSISRKRYQCVCSVCDS